MIGSRRISRRRGRRRRRSRRELLLLRHRLTMLLLLLLRRWLLSSFLLFLLPNQCFAACRRRCRCNFLFGSSSTLYTEQGYRSVQH